MEPLTIPYAKLKEYVDSSGMYRMYEEGAEVTLVFEPTFVEATFHGAGAQIYITGRLDGEAVVIQRFEIEDADGERRDLDLEAARPSLEVWLESMED